MQHGRQGFETINQSSEVLIPGGDEGRFLTTDPQFANEMNCQSNLRVNFNDYNYMNKHYHHDYDIVSLSTNGLPMGTTPLCFSHLDPSKNQTIVDNLANFENL